ncbi:hypothetical protein D6833_10315, partial [Candidatus Parcubacteria bacterium]
MNSPHIFSCIFFGCAYTNFICTTNAIQQDKVAGKTVYDYKTAPVPLDDGRFTLRYPVRYYDEPGVLKYGGYCTGGARMRLYGLRSTSGDVTVEIVDHPPKYSYAKHDFFGAFFAAYREEKNKGDPGSAKDVNPVQYVEWQRADSSRPEIICVLMNRSDEGYYGLVGWYTEIGSNLTTVMMRFGTRGGLPRSVIDEFLDKYPSSIAGTLPSLASWEEDDIEKWRDILATKSDDVRILPTAVAYLRRYDRRAFGLLNAMQKGDDPAA